MYAALIKTIVQVLPVVIGWVDEYLRARARRKRAEERDKINNNPYNYLRSQYGVRSVEESHAGAPEAADRGPHTPGGG